MCHLRVYTPNAYAPVFTRVNNKNNPREYANNDARDHVLVFFFFFSLFLLSLFSFKRTRTYNLDMLRKYDIKYTNVHFFFPTISTDTSG